jgi:hypothetical protein
METDPILKEVHAMKDALARKAGYDLHALCRMLRKSGGRYPKRFSTLRPIALTHREKTGSKHG